MSGSTPKRSPDESPLSVAEVRADAQQRAREQRARQRAEIDAHFGDRLPGVAIIRTAIVSTAVFTALTAITAVVDTRGWRLVTALVDLALFVLGCVLFLVALYRGAQRTREADMTMAGWWFLSGSAPDRVRRVLLGAIGVQTVVAFAGAFARPFTALAFGILVPTLALALSGWWGARHGWFPPRLVDQGTRRR